MGNKRLIVFIVCLLLFGTVGTSEAHEQEVTHDMAWIGRNGYLSTSEQQNNARIVYDYLIARGWSVNAVCAVIGNMEHESNINPNIWEELTVNPSRGYGLVQWTPMTKLQIWADENGLDYTNGDVQLQRIIYEKNNGLQWGRNPYSDIPNEPPITFAQFSVSNLDLTTLANYWMWYYERPRNPHQPARAQSAMYWYNYLTGEEPPDPTPTPVPTPSEIKKMPVWMMCKKRMLML